MKHLLLLLTLLTMTTCGGSTSIRPTCGTKGVGLKHRRTFNSGASFRTAEYYIPITVDGIPLEAVADTGSSNLIIANNTGFTPSGAPGANFTIGYGSGPTPSTSINSISYSGDVDLYCGPGVNPYTYGYIQTYYSNNGNYQETLLGLAYRDLEQPCLATPIPTFFSQLTTGPQALSNEFGMLLCGFGRDNFSRITFGGVLGSVTGLQYVPILPTTNGCPSPTPVNGYYNVAAGKIRIGTGSSAVPAGDLSMPLAQTFVDSGTTVNIIPQAMFKNIVDTLTLNSQSLKSAILASNGNSIQCPDITGMPDITIDLTQGIVLTIPANKYFKNIGGGQCFFGFAPGTDTFVILGQVTMENYYVHFDRKNNLIGFAPNTGLCGN